MNTSQALAFSSNVRCGRCLIQPAKATRQTDGNEDDDLRWTPAAFPAQECYLLLRWTGAAGKRPKVLLAGDHTIVAEGIWRLLEEVAVQCDKEGV
jgi:hypothetical protein